VNAKDAPTRFISKKVNTNLYVIESLNRSRSVRLDALLNDLCANKRGRNAFGKGGCRAKAAQTDPDANYKEN